MPTNQNDVIEVSARGEFNGIEDVVNVFQFQLTSVGDVTEAVTLTDLSVHLDNIFGNLGASQTDDFVYRDLTFRNITQDLVLGVIPWPTLTVGGSASGNLPPGVAGVINMATNVARVVLRKFIGGLGVGILDANGTFTGSLLTILGSFASDLLATLVVGGNDWEYGFFSPKTLAFEVPVGATITDIPGYQRRRKQGRGV